MGQSIENISESVSDHEESIEDLSDGRHADPTCTAIFNPVFSNNMYEVSEYDSATQIVKFNGNLTALVKAGDFIKTEMGVIVKVTQVTLTDEGGGSYKTNVKINDQYFTGYEEIYNFHFQIGLSNTGSNATGENTVASYPYSHAEGLSSQALNAYAHAEGNNTKAQGDAAHAEGDGSQAIGRGTHAEGIATEATAAGAHSEGSLTHATAFNAHAEGDRTTASGPSSHAEGYQTQATYLYSHAEGEGSISSAESSHAEGRLTVASGNYAHAEGAFTTASGGASHAEGFYTTASGSNSHSGGKGTSSSIYPKASGAVSFNHQEVTTGIKESAGANSVILGGKNNSTASTALRSVVLGGDSINATIPDAVYMTSLKLKPIALPTGLVAADAGLIVCDSGDANKIKYWNGTAWTAL